METIKDFATTPQRPLIRTTAYRLSDVLVIYSNPSIAIDSNSAAPLRSSIASLYSGE